MERLTREQVCDKIAKLKGELATYEDLLNKIVSEWQEEPDEETLRGIAYDETASIRDQGYNDYFDGYDLGDIINEVAVDSFIKGYRKAKEGK